jgi:hypothetical protein
VTFRRQTVSNFLKFLSSALVRRFVFVLLKNPASHSQRLEGSRFVARQLYRLAAGGSRERLDVRQLYGPLYSSSSSNPCEGRVGLWRDACPALKPWAVLLPFHGSEPNRICPPPSPPAPRSGSHQTLALPFSDRGSITDGAEPNNGPIPSARVG